MTPAEVKDARLLLGWSRTKLAAAAETTLYTVTIYELRGRRPLFTPQHPKGDIVGPIRAALESAGVEFIELNGEAVPRLRSGNG